ncbi:MAG: NTPase [Caldisericum sp.]|jgi:nucleoside-triphosphatase|nr:NTPase [Caldisericum sp.]
MVKIFVTGLPGCGKTTLMKDIAKLLTDSGVDISGFITEEVREKGFRQGFTIEDLRTGEKLIFASVEQISNIKFGKYFLNIKNFEKIALNAFENAQIVIIDEIGKMEFYSRSFKYYLFKSLEKDINLIATLHRDLVKDFSRYEILALTRENYSDIKNHIIEKLAKSRII